MLNPAFPSEFSHPGTQNYQLPETLVDLVRGMNQANETGAEMRVQKVFGNELWRKLNSLGLTPRQWDGKTVLDLCCGTGFLSYHLLQRVHPAKLVLIDISPEEVREARHLIDATRERTPVDYLVDDVLQPNLPEGTFDIIVGNSFLHHFYDVPKALLQFKRLLKPGGVFAALHEPTEASIAVESGRFRFLMSYLLKGSSYIEDMRYSGPGIAPGGGTDVWIFRAEDLPRLASGAGFVDIQTRSWNLVRPMVVARRNLHLRGSKRQLTSMEAMQLGAAVASDAVLSRLLPRTVFGSICIAARKPAPSVVKNG